MCTLPYVQQVLFSMKYDQLILALEDLKECLCN